MSILSQQSKTNEEIAQRGLRQLARESLRRQGVTEQQQGRRQLQAVRDVITDALQSDDPAEMATTRLLWRRTQCNFYRRAAGEFVRRDCPAPNLHAFAHQLTILANTCLDAANSSGAKLPIATYGLVRQRLIAMLAAVDYAGDTACE